MTPRAADIGEFRAEAATLRRLARLRAQKLIVYLRQEGLVLDQFELPFEPAPLHGHLADRLVMLFEPMSTAHTAKLMRRLGEAAVTPGAPLPIGPLGGLTVEDAVRDLQNVVYQLQRAAEDPLKRPLASFQKAVTKLLLDSVQVAREKPKWAREELTGIGLDLLVTVSGRRRDDRDLLDLAVRIGEFFGVEPKPKTNDPAVAKESRVERLLKRRARERGQWRTKRADKRPSK